MLWKQLWLALIVIALPAWADSSIVEIPATNQDGSAVTLDARLTVPQALSGKSGRHPALVLLHGCDGTDLTYPWVDSDFGDWPYVFLQIDSFDARGIAHACQGYREISPKLRALDAHAARAWLATQPNVDPKRIAVLGWSMGGETALQSVSNPDINKPDRTERFVAAVAFYPYCPTKLRHLDAPLLVLTGSEDDWTPPGTCRAMQIVGDNPPSYERVEYPGATHAFDWKEAPAELFGHKLRYDPAATKDAYGRVRVFLDKSFQ